MADIRFPKMILNGDPRRISLIRSDKEKEELASGDIVEYSPSLMERSRGWNRARVESISEFHPPYPQEIRLVALCGCGADGRPRVDNGLSSGVHCDECWEKMVTECRSRSW